MPRITIDGSEIEVEPGTTVIQAAEQIGIEIPRYCYHPGLTIVGVCRICLVEIERIPRLQVACYTLVNDGMVVYTNNEKVKEARKAVLEFLLINHPLDCPVCDQSGECWLQNYYMQYGLYDSNMHEDKVKKKKAQPIGPNVMLDSERCILCSRCVRFCDEISQSHELGIFNRGDHAELALYAGRELDNDYSGNTIDICPVGALTDRDFRFRTRVWYLNETQSVCPGCSTGCNIYLHHNDDRTYKAGGARISRLKPRYNKDVNEWWMCDEGRYGFTHVDHPNRITSPAARENDVWMDLSWDTAYEQIAERYESIVERHGVDVVGVLLSPKMTNEDLFVARQFFSGPLAAGIMAFDAKPSRKASEDDLLIKADKTPNSMGARKILTDGDVKLVDVAQMMKSAEKRKLKALFIFHHALEEVVSTERLAKAFRDVELVVYVGTNENETSNAAHYCLPSAGFVEVEGTYTNFAGRVQRIHRAVSPLGEAKPDWMILRNFARKLGASMPYFEAEDVFDALTREVPAFAGLSYPGLGESGATLNGKSAEESREELQVA